MKVLFLSLNNLWNPHFETELELMVEHSSDEIYILHCAGDLKSCTCNSNHLKSKCLECKSRFQQGIKLAHIKKSNISCIKVAPPHNYIFHSVDELEKFEIDGVRHGSAVVSNLISELRDTKFDTIKYRKKINKKLNTSISVYTSMVEIIKKTNPDRCYIFNGRFADSKSAIFACEQLGITYYTHERGGTYFSYNLYKNCTIHTSLDLVKDDIKRCWTGSCVEAERWFMDRYKGRKSDQGWILHTQAQEHGLLPKSFDKTVRNIVFFNSSIDEFYSFPEWKENLLNSEEEAIRKISENFPDINFYLRLHPNLTGCVNEQMEKIKSLEDISNLHIILPEAKVDTYALLQASEKVIVFASTIGVEACYFNIPSILIGRAFYESTGCCYIPKSKNELYDLVGAYLEPKPKLCALKYGNWMKLRGEKFKHYIPYDLFSGSFLGCEIQPKLKTKDKILHKLFRRIEVTKNSIEKRF